MHFYDNFVLSSDDNDYVHNVDCENVDCDNIDCDNVDCGKDIFFMV